MQIFYTYLWIISFFLRLEEVKKSAKNISYQEAAMQNGETASDVNDEDHAQSKDCRGASYKCGCDEYVY